MRKRIFITGGASGIGRELAQRYLSAGNDVTLFDRQNAQEVAQALQQPVTASQSQRIRAYIVDVSDARGVHNAFAHAAQSAPPDIVINCAGIASAKPFTDLSADEFIRVITVNLIGSRHVAAAALPYLRDGSQLVFISSMAGLVGCYGYAAYCAAKHGVVGLADVLRTELKAKGITVSVVCPPEVDTPMVHMERTYRPKATETMKLLAGSLTVEHACQQIQAGIQSRRFLIIPGKKARLLWALNKLSPRALTQFVTDTIAARV